MLECPNKNVAMYEFLSMKDVLFEYKFILNLLIYIN